jgi:putative oxidoreductase
MAAWITGQNPASSTFTAPGPYEIAGQVTVGEIGDHCIRQALTNVTYNLGSNNIEGAILMWHAIVNPLPTLRAAEWIPMTAVRVLIGVFFCISGGTKLFVPAKLSAMEHTLAQSHIPFAHANAVFVSLVEFASGAGLVVGLLTQLCAIVLVFDMIVAIATNRIHSIQATGVLGWLDDFLYLPEVLYVMILVWLIFSGPGRYSLDGVIRR